MKKSVITFGDVQLLKKFRKPKAMRAVVYYISVQPLTVSVEMKLGLRRLARRSGIREVDELIRTEQFPVYDGPICAGYAARGVKFLGVIAAT